MVTSLGLNQGDDGLVASLSTFGGCANTPQLPLYGTSAIQGRTSCNMLQATQTDLQSIGTVQYDGIC